MKRMLIQVAVGVLLMCLGGACRAQELEKGNLIGVHVITVKLNPNATMGEFTKFYVNEVIPEYEKNWQGLKGYLLRSFFSDSKNQFAIVWPFQTVGVSPSPRFAVQLNLIGRAYRRTAADKAARLPFSTGSADAKCDVVLVAFRAGAQSFGAMPPDYECIGHYLEPNNRECQSYCEGGTYLWFSATSDDPSDGENHHGVACNLCHQDRANQCTNS
jgi:hypothetical protein